MSTNSLQGHCTATAYTTQIKKQLSLKPIFEGGQC